VLRDLGAHWMVDGVTVSPGAPMLMARLEDGRILIGLPGDPIGALCALMTLATPLIMAMRDDPTPPARTVAISDGLPAPEFAEDTVVHPVRMSDEHGADGRRVNAHMEGGHATLLTQDLHGWAQADSYVVAPPGTGVRGDTLLVLDHLGR
jgi:molybdopterin molybdotransferase